MSQKEIKEEKETASDWFEDGLYFSCHQSGKCCTGPTGYVLYTEEEGRQMAAHLGLTEAEFTEKYTRSLAFPGYEDHPEAKRSLTEVKTEHGFDCVFMTWDEEGKGACGIYEARPHQCRTWPFWPSNLASERDWRSSASRCAGMCAGLKENGQRGKFYPAEQIRIIRDSNNEKQL